ncbi:MAG TPA: amidase family protein, partial [Ilumatobacteraceae bacterium]|nr:amidase family protein [Ilumatobacteraceae bacterium]
DQAAAIRNGGLGAVELLDAQLARIERLGPQVNAVCTLSVEAARERAVAADEATAGGEVWGPMHGVSVTVKDAIATAGIRSTGGSPVLLDHVPQHDAPVVTAIKDAGAIVFGKTNVPLWSGDFQTFNEMFGTTNNPWDLTRVPGGSSGGAAAAVACGMTSFEIGTDIGGSVRVPSAFCGVFGHKPSFGVIPTLGYLDEPTGGVTESDVNVFGPIARSTDDLAMLFSLLAGPTADRSVGWRLDLPPAGVTDVRSLRVATWFDEPSLPMDSDMTAILMSVADRLAAAGASVDRAIRPQFDFTEAWHTGGWLIGAACNISDGQQDVSHNDWLAADRRRARWRLQWAEFFEHVDVLLCPITLTPAFPHQQEGTWATREIAIDGVVLPYLALEAWPALIGSAYLPSTSTPVGHTAAGLPVGVQVVSPYLNDYRSIAVAGLITDLVDGYAVPPIAR